MVQVSPEAELCPSRFQMSELQRLGEQLERRAEELRRTEDGALLTRDELDQVKKVGRTRRDNGVFLPLPGSGTSVSPGLGPAEEGER